MSAASAAKPDKNTLRRLVHHGQQCAIAAIVWDELVYGCERLAAGRRKAELETYLQDVVLKSFPILPYDQEAATWHGFERVRLERAGRPRPYADGQIAAIAYVHDLILVTANVRDFAAFKDVIVENWTR